METENSNHFNRAELNRKRKLFKIGIYGFIGGLMTFMTILNLNIPLAFFSSPAQEGEIFLERALPVLIIMPFISFGVLIFSLFQPPREYDMSKEMKNSIAGIVFFFIGAVMLNFSIPAVSVSIYMILLYAKGGSIIMLSIGYFTAAILFFAAAACYTIIGGLAEQREFSTDIKWINTIFKGLRLEKPDVCDAGSTGGMQSGESGKWLSRADKMLGLLIGIAVFLIFEGEDILFFIISKTGSERLRELSEKFGSTDVVLSLVSVFIFLFSSMMIVKAMRSLAKPERKAPVD